MKKLITNLKVLMTLLLLCGVSSAWAAVTYTKVTSTASLSTGDQIILATENVGVPDIGVTGGTVQNATTTKKDATVSSNESDWMVFTVTTTTGGWYLNNGDNYIGSPAANTFYLTIEGTKGIGSVDENGVFVCNNRYLTVNGTNYRMYQSIGSFIPFYVWKIGAESTKPTILASNVEIEANATSGTIEYTIANPVENQKVSASSTATWISSITVDDANNKVTFNVEPNTGDARTAEVILTYNGADNKTVKVTQKDYIPVYANLTALIAAGDPTGKTVSVVLLNEKITKLVSTNGIMLQVGDKEIEVFCYNRPGEWVVNGTVSGTLTCPWQEYKGTWELCPSSWNDLTYAEPFVQKYTINIADGIVGGAVSTNPADEAAEGKTVSLIATPNAGYALNAWTVEDADGNPVAVTDGTFVMPAKEVYVSATFTEAQYLFYESFNTNSGTGGNDGQWSGNIASSDLKSDNTWTMENAKGADKCAKFGSGSKAGSATTPVINATGDLTLVFKAAAWSGATENTKLNITSSNGTLSTSEITLTKGAWKTYKVYIYGAEDPQITIKAALASNNRFFLDEVYVLPYNTDIVEIGASGYATYSSETYTVIPDPESGVQLFGAKINDEGTAVTLIPTAEGQAIGLKGEGFIVKATPNTTVFIEKTGENGTNIEGNQLVGTVHSEYDLTQGEAYLLSATSDGTPFFGLCNEGTLAPFKAFLPVPAPGVKAILAIEEGGTTGISTIKNAELNVQDAIYNLAGQKVGADYKGIVIRNGKKMLNK